MAVSEIHTGVFDPALDRSWSSVENYRHFIHYVLTPDIPTQIAGKKAAILHMKPFS